MGLTLSLRGEREVDVQDEVFTNEQRCQQKFSRSGRGVE